MSDFEEVYRKTIPRRLRRRASSELAGLIRPLYQQLIRTPADLRVVRECLIRLLSFLATPEYRTHANCWTTDLFFCIRDYWERSRADLPAAFAEILDDVGGCLHDTISAPEIARNFESTPEQLLDRVRRLNVL